MTYHRTGGKDGTRNRKFREQPLPKSTKSTTKGFSKKPSTGRMVKPSSGR